MIKNYTTKSDVNVYLAAAESLGIDYKILYKTNPTIILMANGKKLLFRNTSPSFNSLAAHQMAWDKHLTYKLLSDEGIPFPAQKLFQQEDIAGILKYSEKNFPIVIKPNSGAGGENVFVNITDTTQLFKALNSVLKDQQQKDILIEKYIKGKDYRVVVFRGEIIDIIERVPAYIVGDGESTISELIKAKNKNRIETLGGFVIKIDTELKLKLEKQKLKLNSVPTGGEIVKLKGSCNYSVGGETKRVDVSKIPRENIDLFFKIQKLSFLEYTGIDFITPDIRKPWNEAGGVVNEINSSIGIDIHYYADMKEDLTAPRKVLARYFGIPLDNELPQT